MLAYLPLARSSGWRVFLLMRQVLTANLPVQLSTSVLRKRVHFPKPGIGFAISFGYVTTGSTGFYRTPVAAIGLVRVWMKNLRKKENLAYFLQFSVLHKWRKLLKLGFHPSSSIWRVASSFISSFMSIWQTKQSLVLLDNRDRKPVNYTEYSSNMIR